MIKDELTSSIIGCAMNVHNLIGPGFQEVIYQRCLKMEFEEIGLNFEREKNQAIFYKDVQVGNRRADFVVEEKVIVEIKAVTKLEDVHLAQAKNYTDAYDFPLGLLIQFWK